MTVTAGDAFCLCVRLVCISHVISAAELLVRDAVLQPHGMMSWEVVRLRSRRFVQPRWAGWFERVYGYPQVRRLLWLQLAVATAAALAPKAWLLFPVLVPLLAVVNLVHAFRCDAGSDGSDQMATVVTLSLAVGVATHAISIALGFLAFQSCLSYGVAGWFKALKKSWWNGSFAIGVSRTTTFGVPAFGEFLARRRWLAAVLSSGMVAWECSFPLVLILPVRVSIVMLLAGLCFHLANAVHMGLNTFLWAFAATYPALLYVLGLRGY